MIEYDPVRINLNGTFYQLGFHPPRFTDELIEDIYAFDKFGTTTRTAARVHLRTTASRSRTGRTDSTA